MRNQKFVCLSCGELVSNCNCGKKKHFEKEKLQDQDKLKLILERRDDKIKAHRTKWVYGHCCTYERIEFDSGTLREEWCLESCLENLRINGFFIKPWKSQTNLTKVIHVKGK